MKKMIKMALTAAAMFVAPLYVLVPESVVVPAPIWLMEPDVPLMALETVRASERFKLSDVGDVTRADVSGAVENNFSLRHDQTTWRRPTQSVRCWTL